MIIKVKLGDLTERQMKAICRGYNHCPCCPLRSEDDYTCYFNNDTIPTDYDLDKEIEVSTDFLSPNEAVPFEKRIEDIEREVLRQKVVVDNIFDYLGRPFEKHAVVFRTTEDSFNPPPPQSRCGDCAKFDRCKEQGQTDENETFPETGGCEAFVSKKTVELAKRAPYESWKNYEKSIRHLAEMTEEAEKEKDKL